jgi:hypothetical protein
MIAWQFVPEPEPNIANFNIFFPIFLLKPQNTQKDQNSSVRIFPDF